MENKNYTELLVKWLKDVHALENTLTNVLANQGERASTFPDIQSRLYGHREESMRHASMVETCVTRLGGDISDVRTGLSKAFGEAQAKMLGGFKDSIVRDAIMSSASEQLEISAYTSIITLAEQLGDGETANICNQILEDEEDMLAFLQDNISELVQESYEMDLLTQ